MEVNREKTINEREDQRERYPERYPERSTGERNIPREDHTEGGLNQRPNRERNISREDHTERVRTERTIPKEV